MHVEGGAETLEFSITGGPDAAAEARNRVTGAFGEQVQQRVIEDLTLVIV